MSFLRLLRSEEVDGSELEILVSTNELTSVVEVGRFSLTKGAIAPLTHLVPSTLHCITVK